MKQFNSLSDPMKGAIIGALATILAALIGGIFILRSSADIHPTPTPIVTSTSSPPTATSVTPVPATPTPTPSPTITPNPTATNSQSGGNKPLTCTSGTLCSTYPMTIVITTVTIASIGSSTWNFKITNSGPQPIDAYVYGYIDYNEFNAYGGEVQVAPNGVQTVPITFPAYAPTPGTLQNPQLKFEILPQASSVVYYSQTCTYQASQNTCQS